MKKFSVIFLIGLIYFGLIQGSYAFEINSNFKKGFKASLTSSETISKVVVVFCNNGKQTPVLDIGDVYTTNTNKADICYKIINKSDNDVWVKVDFVNANIRSDGKTFICAADDDEKIGVSKYIKYDKDDIFLGPNETKEFYAWIDLNNGLRGEVSSCLTLKPGNQDKKSSNGNLNLKLRSIFKIKANIIRGLNYDLKSKYIGYEIPIGHTLFGNNGMMYILKNSEGKLILEVPYKNNGLDEIHISGDLKVQGGGLNFLSNDNANLKSGDEKIFRFNVPDLPLFGLVKFIFKATRNPIYDTKSDFINENFDPTSDTYYFEVFQIPYALIIISLTIIIFLSVSFIFYNKKRIKMRNAKQEYIVQKGDSLKKIADNFNCSWKDIASLNKIKAPYVINEGEQIFIYNFLEKK